MRLSCGIPVAIIAITGVLAQTSPQRAEFEVASVRPSGPIVPGQLGIGLHVDGAQVRCNYLSLIDYLGIAYRVRSYQISGPDWLASDRFDISAKLPDGATRAEVPAMLQSLLTERFH